MTISHLNFRVGAVGASSRRSSGRTMSLEQATAWVRKQQYSANVERELLRELAARPQGTYSSYLRNVQTRVREIVKKLS